MLRAISANLPLFFLVTRATTIPVLGCGDNNKGLYKLLEVHKECGKFHRGAGP